MLGLLNMLMDHRALLGISVLTKEHDFMQWLPGLLGSSCTHEIHSLFIISGLLLQLCTEPNQGPGSKVAYNIQLLFTLTKMCGIMCVCACVCVWGISHRSPGSMNSASFPNQKISWLNNESVGTLSSQPTDCTLSMRGRQQWIPGGMCNSPCPSKEQNCMFNKYFGSFPQPWNNSALFVRPQINKYINKQTNKQINK